jgi:hypothetical protein
MTLENRPKQPNENKSNTQEHRQRAIAFEAAVEQFADQIEAGMIMILFPSDSSIMQRPRSENQEPANLTTVRVNFFEFESPILLENAIDAVTQLAADNNGTIPELTEEGVRQAKSRKINSLETAVELGIGSEILNSLDTTVAYEFR